MPKDVERFIRPAFDHRIIELWGVNPIISNDPEQLAKTTVRQLEELELRQAGNPKIIPFLPQGVSILWPLETSHWSIHTWPEPEFEYMHFDVMSCGSSIARLKEILKRDYHPQLVVEGYRDNEAEGDLELQARRPQILIARIASPLHFSH